MTIMIMIIIVIVMMLILILILILIFIFILILILLRRISIGKVSQAHPVPRNCRHGLLFSRAGPARGRS